MSTYKNILSKKEEVIAFFKLEKNWSEFFKWLLFMMLIYVFPIIDADRYFNDDLSRSITGFTGWTTDGRPAAEFLMRFLNFGRPIANIFPLTLIMGVLILAYSLTLYIRNNMPEKTVSLPLIFAGFLVCANPFFLPDISLHFDSFFMMFAMGIAFIPFAVPYKKAVTGIILNFLVVLMIFCIFQPIVGVWFALVFVEIFFAALKGKKIILHEVYRGVGGAAAALLYLVIIAPNTVDKKGWRAEASEISFSTETIYKNFKITLNIIRNYLNGLTKPILVPLLGIVVVSLIAIIYTYLKDNKDRGLLKKIPIMAYLIFAPIIIFIAAVSPLAFLKAGTISDHVLTGISVVMMFFGILICLLSGRVKTILVILILPCMLFQYVYVYTFGNALESQRDYEIYVTQKIAYDIESTDKEGECEYIDIIGSMPDSTQLKMLRGKYPQFRNIVPVYIYPENWIGTAFINHYLQQQLKWKKTDRSVREKLNDIPPDIDNSLYKMYKIEDSIVIVFGVEAGQ